MKRFLLISGIILSMTSTGFPDNLIKRPNAAGQFYTANARQLSAQIQMFLKNASAPDYSGRVEILIVPHAGYKYSGQIAAHAFKYVQDQSYRTVVVIAPSHHFGFTGISVWEKGGYQTPLGVLSVDEEFSKDLIEKDDEFVFDPRVFETEHALEVELPFIQESLPDAAIVPVIMGQADSELCRRFALSLHDLIGTRKDVLIVISSDMSHFHPAAQARQMDEEAIALIEQLDAETFWSACASRQLEMCGFIPVTAALLLARHRGLVPRHLIYGHSGETTGDMKSVVGYTSFIFFQGDDLSSVETKQQEAVPKDHPDETLTLAQKKRLIAIAKETIDRHVRDKEVLDVQETDPRLKKVEGAFVTLHKNGELRGCIGHIIGRKPLYLTVRDMAIAASSQDPRFSPVTPGELPEIEVEVSVLSVPRRVKDPEEIQMGIHGVIVSRGWSQGVFLPQVADETGWDRDTFLSYLCQHKAGLPADAWKDPKTELQIFTAQVFSEHDVAE